MTLTRSLALFLGIVASSCAGAHFALDSQGTTRVRATESWALLGGEGEVRVSLGHESLELPAARLERSVAGWVLISLDGSAPDLELPDPPASWPVVVRDRLGAALSSGDVEAWDIQWRE